MTINENTNTFECDNCKRVIYVANVNDLNERAQQHECSTAALRALWNDTSHLLPSVSEIREQQSEGALSRMYDSKLSPRTCACGMWPVEEYGTRCPSC